MQEPFSRVLAAHENVYVGTVCRRHTVSERLRDLLGLLDEHSHGQAPDQSPRPTVIVAAEAMETPGGKHAFRLAKSGWNADQPGATGLLDRQLTLPWTRLGIRCQ